MNITCSHGGTQTLAQHTHNHQHSRPLPHLTASRLAEVSHGTEFRGEQDGGEEAAVERLHAFAGAFLVGVSAGGEGRGEEDGAGR